MLDDTFIVSARMRDVEQNLEKLRQGAQNQGSATFRRSTIETAWAANYIENSLKNQRQTRTEERSKNGTKIEARDPPRNRRLGRPEASPATQNRAGRPCSRDQPHQSRAKLIDFFKSGLERANRSKKRAFEARKPEATRGPPGETRLTLSIEIPLYPYTLVPLYPDTRIP